MINMILLGPRLISGWEPSLESLVELRPVFPHEKKITTRSAHGFCGIGRELPMTWQGRHAFALFYFLSSLDTDIRKLQFLF
jgi:hypothetical protein